MQLDDRDYKVALAQAQAAYEQAVANLQAATTAVPQQSAMTAAQTAQAQAGISQSASGVLNAQERADVGSRQLHGRPSQCGESRE